MEKARVNRTNKLKPANYYSVYDIMDLVGVSRKTVYNYFSYGLPYIVIGNKRYVHDVRLSEFLEEYTGRSLNDWKNQ